MADYMYVDADNHYYEAEDAFTRYGDKTSSATCAGSARASAATWCSADQMPGQHRVPNPTFNPIATPGAFHARLKELQERSTG